MEQENWWINKNKELFKTKEEYVAAFGRPIAPDEIVIEFDDPCPDMELAVLTTILALQEEVYRVEVWKAEGMKCAHIHIKHIKGLEKLADPIRKRYKRLFVEQYVTAHFRPYVDEQLGANRGKIATEDEPHFKYGTYKFQIWVINNDIINEVEDHLARRAEIELKKETFSKRHYPPNYYQGGSIVQLAEEHGIEVNSSGMALCPFHDDNVPSLGFDDERGLFHCFGCNAGGNIAKFAQMIKEVKHESR